MRNSWVYPWTGSVTQTSDTGATNLLEFQGVPKLPGRKMLHHSPFLHLLKLHNQTIPISQNTVKLFYEVSIRAWLRAEHSDLNLTSVTCLCEGPTLATSPSFQIMWFESFISYPSTKTKLKSPNILSFSIWALWEHLSHTTQGFESV